MVAEIILLHFNLYRFEECNLPTEVRYGGKKHLGFVSAGILLLLSESPDRIQLLHQTKVWGEKSAKIIVFNPKKNIQEYIN